MNWRALPALFAPLLLFVSCSTVGGIGRLQDMSPSEFERYRNRVEAQVQAVAEVAVDEGDVSDEELVTFAEVLDAMELGSSAAAGQVLLNAAQLDGYATLALRLLILELDARLDERGGYGPSGLLTERGLETLRAAAAGIRAVTP